MVEPVDEFTRSIPKLTATGQSFVKEIVMLPFEKEALENDPNPLPPYVPILVSFSEGKGAFEPCAALIVVKPASLATDPRDISWLILTLATGMVPMEIMLFDGLCVGSVIKSFTLKPKTLSWTTISL